ncbi:MAG: glycosyltransferase family 4 protein [bacterium]|nr:glycosyltransferase family 4 protein [bacterium]
MKLLIVTQALDENHPVLGFFVGWVWEFAKHFEKVTVIALSVGKTKLPGNVTVRSLGKEKKSRLPKFLLRVLYVGRFVRYIIQSRREYDTVFVHMNPEYVILGSPVWRMFRKKIALWYNHTHGGFKLSLAAKLSDIVFHTSPYAASARFKNAKRMPAGIDTELFKPHPGIKKHPRSVYFQGRVALSKNVHILLEAFARLYKEGKASRLTIVGPDGDREYVEGLRTKYAGIIASGAVVFLGAVRHNQTPALYAVHTVSVNLAASGGYDKTVLESLASGTPVVLSSKAFADLIPARFTVPEGDAAALSNALARVLEHPEFLATWRDAVVQNHSLAALGERLGGAIVNSTQ